MVASGGTLTPTERHATAGDPVGEDTQRWNELAAQIAVDSIRATTAAGSGHPTSSMSSAHLLAVLFADHLRFDVKDPAYRGNDRFVLSKGHASPGLYATLKAVGAFDDEMLLSLRREGSPLQGHPAPVDGFPWVDVATGSLGQGLAAGLGMALAMRMDDIAARVWVLLGDSEMAEGSVWEAMEATAFHGASSVTAILDMNRLGQRGPTMHGWHADVFRDRALAFGWNAIEIDGHDVDAIDRAYRDATADDRPTLIVARTEKGHGVSFLANQEGWHGKPVPADRLDEAIAELGGDRAHPVHAACADRRAAPHGSTRPGGVTRPAYDAPVATRKAFGEALAWLAATDPDVVALDGEVGNSTYTEDAAAVAPDRFVQMYIAEQCMVGVQTGLQAMGKKAFAATFGAFLARAADQIRMGAISRADLRLCGSHAGVSIGEDGPSQMALEDLALFRALARLDRAVPGRRPERRRARRARWRRSRASPTSARRGRRPRCCTAPRRRSRSAGRRRSRRATTTTSPWSARGSRCTSAWPRATCSPPTASPRACSTATASSRSTRQHCARRSTTPGCVVVVEDHRVEGGLGDAVLDALACDRSPVGSRA